MNTKNHERFVNPFDCPTKDLIELPKDLIELPKGYEVFPYYDIGGEKLWAAQLHFEWPDSQLWYGLLESPIAFMSEEDAKLACLTHHETMKRKYSQDG